jgi:hypothetical protein
LPLSAKQSAQMLKNRGQEIDKI